MRFSKIPMTLVGATVITLFAESPTFAQALSSDCVALQGGMFQLSISHGISANLFAGEIVTVNKPVPAEVIVSYTFNGPSLQTTSGTTHSFTVPTDGKYYWRSDAADSTANWNCTNVPPPPETNEAAELASAAAAIAATNQHNDMSSTTSRIARERLLQRGENGITPRGAYLSTLNLGQSQLDRPEYNFWISGGYTNFSGELTGHSADVLLGVDRLFGENFLTGLMLAYGRTDLEQDGIESVVLSPAVGAYFANRFAGDLLLDGYIAYARPEVEAGGGGVTGERVSASLALTGSYEIQSGTLQPFFNIGGYNQHLPAYSNDIGIVDAEDIERFDANFGARFESARPLAETGLMPYISLAVGYGLTESSALGRDEYVYPRLGLGLSGDVAGGYVSFDLDGSKVSSDTYSVGLNLSWDMKF